MRWNVREHARGEFGNKKYPYEEGVAHELFEHAHCVFNGCGKCVHRADTPIAGADLAQAVFVVVVRVSDAPSTVGFLALSDGVEHEACEPFEGKFFPLAKGKFNG